MQRNVSARIRAQRWYLRYPRTLPAAMFVLVMAVTVLTAWGIERIGDDRTRTQVRAAAQDVSAALERRAVSHVAYLRAGAMLASASVRVRPEGLRELAAGMADDDENRTIGGITWAPRIPVADIANFQAARRAEGLAGFTVHPAPAPGRDFVVPITYISTPEGQANTVVGYDMASEPRRRAAMARAARDNRPTASGKLMLVRHAPGVGTAGFLIYMPVYARATFATGARGQLLGFVCGAFNAQQLLDTALTMVPSRGMNVGLYDGTVDPAHLLAKVTATTAPDLVVTRSLRIAGRTLVLVVAARGHDPLSTLALVTLLFGTLVATLLMLLAHVLTRHAREDLAAMAALNEQIAIRTTLTRELNHRVKNTLANVLSIVALTRRRATGLEQFAQSLTGRIMALSATHDILTALSWEPAPLRAVIEAELAPYTESRDHVITVTGPEVSLAPSDALSLGLAVHELATNASKYGALSVLAGQVTVDWAMLGTDRVQLTWHEQGGPPVAQTRRRGFGTDLVEKIVGHELGHDVELQFDPAGVHCTLVVPVRLPVAFRLRADPAA